MSLNKHISAEKAFFNGGFFNPSLIENLYPLPPLEDVEYSNICEEDINDEHMADEKIVANLFNLKFLIQIYWY